MENCVRCGIAISNLKQFRSHYNFYHHREDVFCPVADCGACYSVFNSFRRHYMKHHNSNTDSSSVINLSTNNGI